MALIIQADEVIALARQLAAETHESVTQAVTVALRERLQHVRRDHRSADLADSSSTSS
jgi:antitoxin VapB